MAKSKHTKQKSGKKLKPLWIILATILVIAAVASIIFFVFINHKPSDTIKETEFVEEELETFGIFSNTVEVDDPELGHLTLEPIVGATKNSYENSNFKEDENGYKAYYVNGKKASNIGVDLSEYQGNVDFEKVKEAGIDYVMLRIAVRGYGEEGTLFKDEMFDTYYENAMSAGLKVGAYMFSQATTVEEAIEEADYCLNILDGRKLDYPVAFDWEVIADDNARTDNIDHSLLTDFAKAFCDEITDNDYKSMIYSNTALMYYNYDLSALKDYDFWVADYGTYPSMYYGFTMWQYTKDGHTDGIDGTVDLNINFKNY